MMNEELGTFLFTTTKWPVHRSLGEDGRG